jgi:hypothetical protein
MESLEMLVLAMQLFSLLIVAAGAYLCLVHAGVLPAKPAMGGFALAASCVLFGAALGAVALSLAMPPVEAAAYDELAVYAEPVLSVPANVIAYEPPAAPVLGGDSGFHVYEYH